MYLIKYTYFPILPIHFSLFVAPCLYLIPFFTFHAFFHIFRHISTNRVPNHVFYSFPQIISTFKLPWSMTSSISKGKYCHETGRRLFGKIRVISMDQGWLFVRFISGVYKTFPWTCSLGIHWDWVVLEEVI